MILSDADFMRIVRFMKGNYGVNLIQKRTLIVGRLENYLVRNGYDNYTDFLNLVERSPMGDEARTLINYLTTNHTYFMREPVHFNFMREIALPSLRESERDKRDIRTWSAAASSGEEAYTIVMVLQDFFRLEQARWDTKLLATDISTKALEKGMEGVYNEEQLEHIPQNWKRCYFVRQHDGNYRVNEAMRGEVIFKVMNLMQPFPFRSHFHIIFLRNVMIYFDDDTKKDLLERVYDVMEPGGYLFIGTTETIDRDEVPLEYIQPSIYRKRQRGMR